MSNILNDLEELKSYFTELTIEDIDKTLEELPKVLKKQTHKNNILSIKNSVNASRQNAITQTDEQKRISQIQHNQLVLGFIDSLKERHIADGVFGNYEAATIESQPTTIPNQENIENAKPLVALLIFPNDASLKNLNKEKEAIQSALLHFKKDGGNIEVITLSTVDSIFEYFDLYQGQIGLIHYGGHASGKGLFIDDKEANAGGLARLIGSEPNLQFVFLNGCATKGQVELLQENNVPVVLATAAPISDSRATNFAIRFYQKLALFGGNNTLEKAFDNAKAYIEMTETTPVEITTRGFVFEDTKPIDSFKWSLYVNIQFKITLNWKLPSKGVDAKRIVETHEIPTKKKVVEISEIERKSLEKQKKLLERKIGKYKERLIKGGLSIDHEIAAEDAIEEMETQLQEINNKLGL